MNVEAWWFSGAGGVLGQGDGRKAAVGITHKVNGEIIPCYNGLHGSAVAMDALGYAQRRGRPTGIAAWRVRLSGDVVEEQDEYAASSRTYLALVEDTDDVLWRFAWLCAADAHHLWSDEPLSDCLRNWKEKNRNGLLGVRDKAKKDFGTTGSERTSIIYAALAAADSTPHPGLDASRCASRLAANAEMLAIQERGEHVNEDETLERIRDRHNDRLTTMLEQAINHEST